MEQKSASGKSKYEKVPGSRWDRILPAMQKIVQRDDYPGMGILVWQHDKVVYEQVTGWMDRETRQPLQMDTLLRMYSMTKPVTCTAMLMLMEEGKFLLDDAVSRYIPAFAKTKVYAGKTQAGLRLVDPERPMTIRHLFTHTSGLSYGFSDSQVDKLYAEAKIMDGLTYGVQPLDQTVEKIAALPLLNHPGATYTYSVSHDVLGYLVSLLSDMPFDEFVKTRILEPLEMADTGFWIPAQKGARMASLYICDQDKKVVQAVGPGKSHFHQPPVAALGGMGLVSTLPDYLKFARMLLNRGALGGVRLLARKTVELMTSNQLNPVQMQGMGSPEKPNFGFGYGLGVGVVVDRGLTGFMRSTGSFGWGGAAGTDCIIDPQEDLIILLMTQVLEAPYSHSTLLQNLVYQALE